VSRWSNTKHSPVIGLAGGAATIAAPYAAMTSPSDESFPLLTKATLQEPVSSMHVQSIAETILRNAKEGERDPATLQRMALLGLQISKRD
jgi:hypothetical protein